MIDEFPILFVAAAMARGRTVASGLEELRVKESDRLALMARGLIALGVTVEKRADGLAIKGGDGAALGGPAAVAIGSALDHRIAMSFAIAGLVSTGGVEIDDMTPVATSFPGFADTLRAIGATP